MGCAHREQMGVKSNPSLLQAGQRESKANQLAVIKGSDPYATGGPGGDSQGEGCDVSIFKLPNLFFQPEGKIEVRKRFQITNRDPRLGS